MYLKIVKSKNYKYLKICKSYRKDGKVHQKVIANLGRLDKLQESGLEKVIYALMDLINPDNKEKFKDITKMKEVNRYNYGYLAYAQLWKMLAISKILHTVVKDKKIEFDFIKTVFSMVINRLLDPSSKLYHFNHKERYLFVNEDIELHNLYRSLDILAEKKEEIEMMLFEQQRDLFNMELDVVFYDVTTYYFESREMDELKDFGFSKDNKVNEVQIVMGLLIDKEGRPIGYELFRGNTVDSRTMVPILKKLKEKFKIDRIIFVADKGLNSKLNLKELKDNGFDYVVSGRLRQLPEELKEEILKDDDYQEEGNYEYKEIAYSKVINYRDSAGQKHQAVIPEKLVCTYSSRRAAKDMKERERLVEKAKKIVEEKQKWIVENKKGHRKYIKKEFVDGAGAYDLQLDEERIKEESRYDGYYVIETSDLNLDPLKVIKIYHNLWKVEESFRILKSTMKVRPIFHWTPKRIEGHFVMSFIAFLLERELEARLKRNKKVNDEEVSVEKIKEALNQMEVSEIEVDGGKIFLKSKHNVLASKIFNVLKINNLKHVSTPEEMRSYYSQFSL